MIKKIYILLIVAIIGSSCKKDTPTYSVTYYLSEYGEKRWLMVEFKKDGKVVNACDTDNIFDFSFDKTKENREQGTFKIDENIVNCDLGKNIADKGYWSVSENQKVIYMYSTDNTTTTKYDIISLDKNNLKVRRVNYYEEEIEYGVSSFTYELTFEAI